MGAADCGTGVLYRSDCLCGEEVTSLLVVYPILVAEMAKNKMTKTTVARTIGISTRSLYSKLNGKTDFTLSEADKIHSVFFPYVSKDELFSRSDVAT